MSVSVPSLRLASNCLRNLNLKILSQEIKLLARLPIVARCKHRRLSEHAIALDAQSQRRIRNLAPSPEDAARRHGRRRVRAGVAAEQPILTLVRPGVIDGVELDRRPGAANGRSIHDKVVRRLILDEITGREVPRILDQEFGGPRRHNLGDYIRPCNVTGEPEFLDTARPAIDDADGVALKVGPASWANLASRQNRRERRRSRCESDKGTGDTSRQHWKEGLMRIGGGHSRFYRFSCT
ncbi:hypothetical protein DFH08DRAFT_855898 [Mycena albidolilacea]|uniref:Uncharacterized protein n=1 Tax=Mycena albidolilacea TaxID=1033008 RepID=A0AAD7EVZ9_9AGAR|nr:hypothetical protein DFH08DRAFT_855898 [Mycena albidolilacea]